MDILDVFCERMQVSYALGFLPFKDTDYEKAILVPCISVNIGEGHEPISDKLAFNAKLIMETCPTEKGLVAYSIHGDYLEAGAIIREKSQKIVAEELFFNFSAIIQVKKEAHIAFQKGLSEIGFWVLRIEAMALTLVAVNSKTDEIITILEVQPSVSRSRILH
jgi:hypothetical protein